MKKLAKWSITVAHTNKEYHTISRFVERQYLLKTVGLGSMIFTMVITIIDWLIAWQYEFLIEN